MRAVHIIAAACFVISAPAWAQYRYVTPDGTVTYSDTPPPPAAKDVQVKRFDAGPSTAGLPLELRQAVSRFPVTIYTGIKCPPCDAARNFLHARGVPYSEKTVSTADDMAALKKISNDTNLPVLVVGAQKLTGFSSTIWGSMLDDARYPATSKLPPTYQNPAPQPATPHATASATENAPAQSNAPSDQGANTESGGTQALPVTKGNAPPGFKF